MDEAPYNWHGPYLYVRTGARLLALADDAWSQGLGENGEYYLATAASSIDYIFIIIYYEYIRAIIIMDIGSS